MVVWLFLIVVFRTQNIIEAHPWRLLFGCLNNLYLTIYSSETTEKIKNVKEDFAERDKKCCCCRPLLERIVRRLRLIGLQCRYIETVHIELFDFKYIIAVRTFKKHAKHRFRES